MQTVAFKKAPLPRVVQNVAVSKKAAAIGYPRSFLGIHEYLQSFSAIRRSYLIFFKWVHIWLIKCLDQKLCWSALNLVKTANSFFMTNQRFDSYCNQEIWWNTVRSGQPLYFQTMYCSNTLCIKILSQVYYQLIPHKYDIKELIS